VYSRPREAFRIEARPLRPPAVDEVLVRISMATICRSDIHSWQGHRPNPCPGVLGHEIIGRIAALGSGIAADMRGTPLHVGDRITWSEYFVPSPGYYADVLDLPQKSPGVDKYGHMSIDTPPHHHGGFGEYCYVLPRSWMLRLPDELTDEEATPLNCGVATMMAVTEAASIGMGSTVVVQGLGLLGLYGAAIAKAHGARYVIGLDTLASRRERSQRFGVDSVFDPSVERTALVREIQAQCPPYGPDAVIEVCGVPEAVPLGIDLTRIGGTYVLAGLVNPNAMVTIDANLVLRKMLTVRGVHNYHPRHLIQALDFVIANRSRFPFHSLVDAKYPLERVGDAMIDAADHRVLRAAIVP
jgi:alcohol dehydrogenase